MPTTLPKVVVREPLPDGGLEPLDGVARIVRLDRRASRGILLETLADADAFLAMLFDQVDDELLDAAPRLRIVANCAAGTNNVDLQAAQKRGVWVTNTPGVLSEATADLAIGLMLAVTRRFDEAEAELREGRYQGWSLTHMMGAGLQERTLGIVGFGSIGQAVARRALAFGMCVVYTDRRGRELINLTDLPVARVSFDTLLVRSHVISLHVPLVDETYHLIDDRALARARKGTYLINTSRGPVVDEPALARALRSGQVAGAGLDVFENEPAVHPDLLAAPNTVLLPHIGSATLETRRAMATLAARNAARLLSGEEPLTVVVRGNR
jgi:glyoxylate reductase